VANAEIILAAAAGRRYLCRMTMLKQLIFSVAFAVCAVAAAEYVMWILEQNGWISP
jgi:hypothetical protein